MLLNPPPNHSDEYNVYLTEVVIDVKRPRPKPNVSHRTQILVDSDENRDVMSNVCSVVIFPYQPHP